MAHQGQLVVAGFALPVAPIGDGIGPVFQQDELRFDAGAKVQSQGYPSTSWLVATQATWGCQGSTI